MSFLIMFVRVVRGFIYLIAAMSTFNAAFGVLFYFTGPQTVPLGAFLGFTLVKIITIALLVGVVLALGWLVHYLHVKSKGERHPRLKSIWMM